VQRANKARGFIGEDVRGGIGGLYPLRCGWMMKMEAEALRRATGFNEGYVSRAVSLQL
jgi:hypothetical protein